MTGPRLLRLLDHNVPPQPNREILEKTMASAALQDGASNGSSGAPSESSRDGLYLTTNATLFQQRRSPYGETYSRLPSGTPITTAPPGVFRSEKDMGRARGRPELSIRK